MYINTKSHITSIFSCNALLCVQNIYTHAIGIVLKWPIILPGIYGEY